MSQQVAEMYTKSSDILDVWMKKLFPSCNQGCINFGYWEGIKKPITAKKRNDSQKHLYHKMFSHFGMLSGKVLEVGCGRGHGVYWLREKGYEAFGIDILASQIQKCKKGYPSLSPFFNQGSAECLPLEKQSVDCVCSLEAAQHFSSFEMFCEESFRVLKKDGQMVICTYFLTDDCAFNRLKKIIPDNLEGFHNALVISKAISVMQAKGFEVSLPPLSIGSEVFPFYSEWQKKQLGGTSDDQLSPERKKWKEYYTGGGKDHHPWHQAFEKGWVDYFILEGTKTVNGSHEPDTNLHS